MLNPLHLSERVLPLTVEELVWNLARWVLFRVIHNDNGSHRLYASKGMKLMRGDMGTPSFLEC